MEIKTVAILGLGAIGGFMASKLSKVLPPEALTIIAAGERKEKLEQQGILINDKTYHFNVVDPAQKGITFDLILIATKYGALEEAIEQIAGQVGEQTVIMSLLNGVSSEEKLKEHYGEHVIYSLMRVSSVRNEKGIYFDEKGGQIEFGEALNSIKSERVKAIETLFNKAGIKSVIPPNMQTALWYKFACNIAENQSSALLGIPFGAWHKSTYANHLREIAMREVFQVAIKKGVEIGDVEEIIKTQQQLLRHIPYQNKTSMLQDIEHKRPTEIEMFAGEMIRMGQEVGVPTPINEVFYDAIHVLEEKNKGLI